MPGLEIRGRQKMSNINCLHIDHFQLRLVIALLICRVDHILNIFLVIFVDVSTRRTGCEAKSIRNVE